MNYTFSFSCFMSLWFPDTIFSIRFKFAHHGFNVHGGGQEHNPCKQGGSSVQRVLNWSERLCQIGQRVVNCVLCLPYISTLLSASPCEFLGLILGQFLWDWWWMKWHWDRFFSECFSFSRVSSIPPMVYIYIHSSAVPTSYRMGTRSLLGVKYPGHGVNHPPPI
jgi:hypothetical protein